MTVINRDSDQFLLDSYTGKGGYQYTQFGQAQASGTWGAINQLRMAVSTFFGGGVGSGTWTLSYLVRHPRESDDKFNKRRESAVYPNYTKKVVDIYIGFLWKQEPARSSISELYTKFVANADGNGQTLNYLLTIYQRLAVILGTVYIIVDKPVQQATSKADEKLPYLALRLKSQLVAETKDGAGGWDSVTFIETANGAEQYRTYTRIGWKVSKDLEGKQIISQGEHNLGRVPVVRLHSTIPLMPTDSCAQSWIHDLANLNWKLFNQLSERDEILRGQTFSILTLPVNDPAERDSLKDLTVSTENAITYNPQGGGKPAYTAPPDGPVEQYSKTIREIKDDIYSVSNLEFVGISQQSEVALSFQFQQTNSTIAIMADLCEQAERDIKWFVHHWQNQDDEGNIAYPHDFNLSDLSRALIQAMDSINLQICPTFDKAVKKRVARQVLGTDVSPTEMAEIDNEIDSEGDLYGDRLAQQAGL